MQAPTKIVMGIAGLSGTGVGGCYALGLIGGNNPSGLIFPINAPYQNDQEKAEYDQWVKNNVPTTTVSNPLSKNLSWILISKDSWSPQSLETNQTEEGTFGKIYARDLIGINGHSTNKEAQKQQWERIYNYQDTWARLQYLKANSSQFSDYVDGIKTAFDDSESTDKPTSLNKLCGKIYNTQLKELKSSEKSAAWKLCSYFQSTPFTMNKKGFETGTIGSLANSKERPFINANLNTINDEATKDFWNLKDRLLRDSRDSIQDDFFKQYAYIDADQINAAAAACEAAYKTKANSTEVNKTQPKMEETIKYCTFPKEN